MVYNFTLPPLLLHTLLCGDVSKLRDWLNSLKAPSERTTFFNFTASHDGVGVRPVEGILTGAEIERIIGHIESRGGRVSYKKNEDGSQSPYELNSSYVDAITDPAEPLELQVKRFLVSQAIALSMAGVPGIYIHSLLGSHNNLSEMQQSGQNRSINRQKLRLDDIQNELADDDKFRARVFSGFVDLIRKRWTLPAFDPNGAQKALDVSDAGVLALLRKSRDDAQHILAIFNVTNQPRAIDLSAYVRNSCRDVISGEVVSAQLKLAPYQVCWLDVSETRDG
jgi:sucrose phosphorylase